MIVRTDADWNDFESLINDAHLKTISQSLKLQERFKIFEFKAGITDIPPLKSGWLTSPSEEVSSVKI